MSSLIKSHGKPHRRHLVGAHGHAQREQHAKLGLHRVKTFHPAHGILPCLLYTSLRRDLCNAFHRARNVAADGGAVLQALAQAGDEPPVGAVIIPVSYTHLDVYKRQEVYHEIQKVSIIDKYHRRGWF